IGQLVELVAQFIVLICEAGTSRVASNVTAVVAVTGDIPRRVHAADVKFLRRKVLDAQLAIIIGRRDFAFQLSVIIDLGNELVDALGQSQAGAGGAGNRGGGAPSKHRTGIVTRNGQGTSIGRGCPNA